MCVKSSGIWDLERAGRMGHCAVISTLEKPSLIMLTCDSDITHWDPSWCQGNCTALRFSLCEERRLEIYVCTVKVIHYKANHTDATMKPFI